MVALLVAAIALAASGAGNARPELTIARAAVHGAHFVARERITVKFAAGKLRTTRHTRASGAGRFATAVPFQDPCLGEMVVVARGSTGDSARLKLPQRACPPADSAHG